MFDKPIRGRQHEAVIDLRWKSTFGATYEIYLLCHALSIGILSLLLNGTYCICKAKAADASSMLAHTKTVNILFAIAMLAVPTGCLALGWYLLTKS